ncbi:pentapeptide repeat-containing protein [Streptomyces sp. NPDC048416]|uniref:pentapeptide repeat-containing protein n=1 Tax=Streptomyces sp. NPDC048416 TaxID=3365546 RepID=UPI003715D006
MSQITRQGGKIKGPDAPRIPTVLRPAGDVKLEDDAILKRLAFDGQAFVGLEAEAVEADGCTFANVRFTGTGLRQTQFSDSKLTTCDFSQMSAGDVSLIRCLVEGSRLTGSSWKAGTFRDAQFVNCVATPGMFRNMKVYATVFEDCRFTGIDFQFTEFHNVRFVNCDLTGAQFGNAKVGSMRIENCTLLDVGGGANLKGTSVAGPGSMELALSLAREAGITFE